MNMLYRFCQLAALCTLLLGFSVTTASADEVQDANKLFKQGQHAQALEKVEAILVHKPKEAPARFLKGLIKAEQGNTDEAIRIFTALTADYPELPEPYNNLAVLYAGQGQYEKAKVALEKALRTHPSYATAHDNLGDIYAKMASQAYDRALQLDRGNTPPQTKLALINDLFGGKGSKIASGRDTAVAAATQATTPAAATSPLAPTAAAASSAPSVSTASLQPVQPAATVSAVALPTASASKPAAAASSSEEVLQAVHAWAAAWSSNNVPLYLAFYAKDFKVPKNESRRSWEKQRRDRIAKPKSIHVSVDAARVKLTDNSRASVTFRQNYRSGTLKTSTLKTLEMVKLNGKWLILEERTGK